MRDARITLIQYPDSVYCWSVRIALAQCAVPHDVVAANPFDPEGREVLLHQHPFGRVPVLKHGTFTLFESQAILTYLARAFPGPGLIPDEPTAQARMVQVMGICDAYGYQPLVRQVFAQAVFRPYQGLEADTAEIEAGLSAAEPVLSMLEALVSEGLVLDARSVTLADVLALPMLLYFQSAAQGAELLARYPHLSRWLDWGRGLDAVRATRPPVMNSWEETE